VTDLAAEMRRGTMRSEERIARTVELDQKLELAALASSPAWTFERMSYPKDHRPKSVPDDSFLAYDVYPDRMMTQMWNVLRLTRILLCEELIESCTHSSDPNSAILSERATLAVLKLVREICASVPQMTDCNFAAKHKLSSGSTSKTHTHTMPHILDVYILIFSLYVVAWSRTCPRPTHDWALAQLQHIASHFEIRESAVILEILKKQEKEDGVINPWYVYNFVCTFGYSQHRFYVEVSGRNLVC
jgi:hypothetical protein